MNSFTPLLMSNNIKFLGEIFYAKPNKANE